jgi:hypothetical protein
VEIPREQVKHDASAEREQGTMQAVFDNRPPKQHKDGQAAPCSNSRISQPLGQAKNSRRSADRADDARAAESENQPSIDHNGVRESILEHLVALLPANFNLDIQFFVLSLFHISD